MTSYLYAKAKINGLNTWSLKIFQDNALRHDAGWSDGDDKNLFITLPVAFMESAGFTIVIKSSKTPKVKTLLPTSTNVFMHMLQANL